MSDDHDFERATRAFLEEGSDRTPPATIDAVLLAVRTTPQERDLRIPWRTTPMSNLMRLVAAMAVTVVVGVVALNLFGASPDAGGVGAGGSPSASPVPTPTPTPTPTSTPTPTNAPSAAFPEFPGVSDDVAPGTYLWSSGATTPADITFTLPAGWQSRFGIPNKDRGGPGEIAVGNWIVSNVYADPCRWQESLLDPAVGPTVDDLASAMAAQKDRNASAPTDVTLGGYPAKRVELSIPTDLDLATCDQGAFRTWVSPGDNPFAIVGSSENLGMHPGQRDVVYIVDVDGDRLVIATWHMPDTSAADLAELDTILASMRIEP